MNPVAAPSSSLLLIRRLFRRARRDVCDHVIRRRRGAGVAQSGHRIGGEKNDGPGGRGLLHAIGKSLNGPFLNDDDFLEKVQTRFTTLFARIKRGDVAVDVVDRRRRSIEHGPTNADLGWRGRELIPRENCGRKGRMGRHGRRGGWGGRRR